MRVGLMKRGSAKVTEIVISDRGSVGEALKVAKVPASEWGDVRVTDVSVCMGTALRSEDIVIYGNR